MTNPYYTKVLFNYPRVEVIDNFIDGALCGVFIEAAIGNLKRATVVGGNIGVESHSRTGSNLFISHDYSEQTLELAEKMANIVNIPLSHAEKYQIVNYGVGQEYKPHFDSFDDESDIGWESIRPSTGGQRTLTFMIFLNNVEEGGELIFPRIDNLIIEPKKGRAVIYDNTLPGVRKRDPLSLQGTNPVKQGEEWAVNLWFRQNPR